MFSFLVTGLFREPTSFARMVKEWRSIPCRVSEIVTSAWPTEVPQFEGLIAQLGPAPPPVRFVINPEPILDFARPANSLRQRRLSAPHHRCVSDNFLLGCALGQASFRPSGHPHGICRFGRQLDAASDEPPFAQEFAGFGNRFYAWTRESFDRVVGTLKARDGFATYAEAFDDPLETMRTTGDRLFEAPTQALRAAVEP